MTQILINGIIAGSAYALIAVGFSLIYSTVRFFHFAHGAVYAVAAYIGWALYTYCGFPFGVCVTLSFFSGALLGVYIYLAIYVPLKKKNSPQLVYLLASFAVFVILTGILQLFFGGDVQTYKTFSIQKGLSIAGAVVTDYQLLIIALGVLASAVLSIWLSRASFGKAIRAVADDPIAASIVGINSRVLTTGVFGIGSALAGLAGVLLGVETNLYPAMGFDAVLKGIVAALIGGIGNIYGAILGGLVLGLAENIGIIGISAGWKDSVAFIILVLFLLARPQGVTGKKVNQREI